jgi:hypothetical protein
MYALHKVMRTLGRKNYNPMSGWVTEVSLSRGSRDAYERTCITYLGKSGVICSCLVKSTFNFVNRTATTVLLCSSFQ